MDKKRDSFFLNKKGKEKPEGSRNEPEKHENKQEERQQEFDMNWQGHDNEKQEKIPFDKKTYRLKKYSKKYKLDQWEEQRKKKLLRDYHNEVKNDPTIGSYKPVNFDEDVTDANDAGKYVRHPSLVEKMNATKFVKMNRFKKAREEKEKMYKEKAEKLQEMEKVKKMKLEKLQAYKKMKQERYKKLSKKNKKGQPALGARMEILLEKIQKGA